MPRSLCDKTVNDRGKISTITNRRQGKMGGWGKWEMVVERKKESWGAESWTDKYLCEDRAIGADTA